MIEEEFLKELDSIKEDIKFLKMEISTLKQENIKDEDVQKISRWNNLPKLKDLKS